MRTTLTIDDDIAKLLDQEVKQSGESYKGTVNRLLRLGLAVAKQPQPTKRFVIRPRKMGLPPGLSYDSISTLLEQLEGPGYR